MLRHHDQSLRLPAEFAEPRAEPPVELRRDLDAPVGQPHAALDLLGRRDQLLDRRLAVLHAEQVEVVDVRQLAIDRRGAEAERHRLPRLPVLGRAQEVEAALELAHSSRSGWPSMLSSAMSRRKKSEVVQSVTTRSFRWSSGSW